jgi:CsoR family transcriptional regulator, copper-sensing transcriptional repressor
MCQKDNKALRARLKRIEGQVRGVSQMVADDRYCIDILHQIHAIKAALAKVDRNPQDPRRLLCRGSDSGR